MAYVPAGRVPQPGPTGPGAAVVTGVPGSTPGAAVVTGLTTA